MKKTITTIFFFCTISLFAQKVTSIKNVADHLFKINLLLTPGLEYEVGVSKNTTIDFRLGTGFAYRNTFGNERYGIFLSSELAYRYYYNFDRRESKGKNISKNSANYIAMTSTFASGDPIIGKIETAIDYIGLIGPVWGIQRTYGAGFNLGLELGMGYRFDNLDSDIAPIINFRLGWTFGK
ncbi:hypothetical protein ABW636_18405 [Aquimarina sp. 2201CG1-2-11]|uniref:hypothetical protein n=1 Tax=Aquimarina discodermiae TaxID=3231043 RepID=UPI003461B072